MAIPIKRYVDIYSSSQGTPSSSDVSKPNYPAFSFSDVVGIIDSPIMNFSNGNFATPKTTLSSQSSKQ